MIDKARQLKQFIQEFNIQDKYGLKNAVNYHVKDEALQQLLKACVQKDVLAAFLKANANQQAIGKAFCREQEQLLLDGSERLNGKDAKTAIRYCLYLADVIKDEDIAKREAEKRRLAINKPKPKPTEPTKPIESVQPKIQRIEKPKQQKERQKPVILPISPKESKPQRPKPKADLVPMVPIEEVKEDRRLVPQKRNNKQLSRKEKARLERVEKRKKMPPPKYEKRSLWSTFRWFFLLLFLGLLGFGLFKGWNYYQDLTAPKRYCLATSLSIREYPRDDATKLGNIDFGEEMIYYGEVPLMEGWAEVKGRENGIHGFVSMNYLASKKYFWELNSILGDEKAYFDTGITRNRRALKTYFEQQKYCGVMPNRIKLQLYTGKEKRECYAYWQIFTKDRSSVLTKLDLTGNGKEDFVFMLNNAKSDGKKLVVCKYDENLMPSFHEMILPDDVKEIFPVKRTDRTKDWYIGNRKNSGKKIKERIKRDAFYFEREDVEGKKEKVLIYYRDGRVHEYVQ